MSDRRRSQASQTPSKKTKPLDQSIRNANMIKPQTRFDIPPDNYSVPWKPLLTRKPHATIPLDESLAQIHSEGQSIQYERPLLYLRFFPISDVISRYKHPYETEIQNLQYPDSVFEARDPIKYQPAETTAAVYVDTYEGVLQMLEELKSATEIAIDTEHHDWRTFGGLLSLMQISTRDKDWIVDTLQPWRQKLEVLNEVFASPTIVKVGPNPGPFLLCRVIVF